MNTKSGFIAIVGRPNVGKSTFLNNILKSQVSITANKPQTTRHRILGIKTIKENQLIFVDTPGIHTNESKAINKLMNKAAKSSVFDAEAIVFVIESKKWNAEDELVLNTIKKLDSDIPVFLLVNKIDSIKDKEELLPFLKDVASKYPFKEIFPISATNDKEFKNLEAALIACLPESPHYFEGDRITDKDLSFRLQEMVREKLTRILGKELPFSITVQIEKITKKPKVDVIHAIIWVDRASHKPIVIGKRGAVLKEVGTLARADMERLLGTKVHLELWVKIKSGWSDSHKDLQEFGYVDED